MISQKLQEFEEEVKPIGGVLTQATLELYHAITARFLPTPAKIHYLFNLRDISKVRNITCDSLSSGKRANCGLDTPSLSIISLQFRPIDYRKMKQNISVHFDTPDVLEKKSDWLSLTFNRRHIHARTFQKASISLGLNTQKINFLYLKRN